MSILQSLPRGAMTLRDLADELGDGVGRIRPIIVRLGIKHTIKIGTLLVYDGETADRIRAAVRSTPRLVRPPSRRDRRWCDQQGIDLTVKAG